MTPEQEAHLSAIIHAAQRKIETKYVRGEEEHGGNLWEKRGIIDMAIDEAIDQITYLLTLKQQIEAAGVELGSITE